MIILQRYKLNLGLDKSKAERVRDSKEHNINDALDKPATHFIFDLVWFTFRLQKREFSSQERLIICVGHLIKQI